MSPSWVPWPSKTKGPPKRTPRRPQNVIESSLQPYRAAPEIRITCNGPEDCPTESPACCGWVDDMFHMQGAECRTREACDAQAMHFFFCRDASDCGGSTCQSAGALGTGYAYCAGP